MRHRRFGHRWILPLLIILPVVMATTANADSILEEDLLGVTAGVSVFPTGASLGVEISGADDAIVERVILFSGDTIVANVEYDPCLGAELWFGVVPLRDASGTPFPAGEYALAVVTGGGALLATVQIVDDITDIGGVEGPPSVSFAGPSLLVYRLLSEEESGEDVTVRDGDRILVALSGNPTTGYEWSDKTENLLPVLEPIDGRDYIQTPAPEGLVGGGGTFLFRYRAFAQGSQLLRYEYARPWETVAPAHEAVFAIQVVE